MCHWSQLLVGIVPANCMLGVERAHVSISHTEEMAVAVVALDAK